MNYDFVQNFGLNYVKVATMLVAYWVSVVSILNYHSTCRGEDMDDVSCKYHVSFKALLSEVNDAMFAHAKKLKKTVTSLSKKCEKSKIKAKWPWNQKCEDFPGKCNYEYLLITTQTDQESIVAGCAADECKMLITEEFDVDDIVNYCNKLNTTDFYGGILGWQSDSSVPEDSKTCVAAANKANKFNNDFSMLAIPRYVRLALLRGRRGLFFVSPHFTCSLAAHPSPALPPNSPTHPPTHTHTHNRQQLHLRHPRVRVFVQKSREFWHH